MNGSDIRLAVGAEKQYSDVGGFGRRVLLLSAEDDVNMIVLAFRGGPARIAWDELKARSRALNRLYGIEQDRPALVKYTRALLLTIGTIVVLLNVLLLLSAFKII